MEKEIKIIIEKYVQGTCTGNVNILKSVFQTNAVMSGDLGSSKLVLASPNLFFEDIAGYEAPESYNYSIENIRVEGDIATVELKEFNLKDRNFVNYFQLQKIDNQWKIISKLFTSL